MTRPTCPYLYPPQPGSSFRPHFSYEFFPALTQPGSINLSDRIQRMAALGPAAISVTWGAGGSTSERSLDLAEFVATSLPDGVECVLHLTCTNMERDKIVSALDRAKELGIKNVLALRGDPPRDAEYAPASAVPVVSSDAPFVYAIDLVRFIRQNYGDAFCIGVAGYPDTHPDAPSPASDVSFLKAKVDAGADFIITQLFYDVDVFLAWQKRCREADITIPIIPGVMPIQNYTSFRRMTNLCKASVPQQIIDDLEPIRHDDTLVKDYGVRLSTAMTRRLVEEGKIEGVHFCTLNLEKSVRRVLESLEWIEREASTGFAGVKPINALIEDPNDPRHAISPPSLVVSSAGATLHASASHNHTTPASSLAPAGKVEANSISSYSWDEYPNGHFTDTRSPAYGELDGYGGGLKILPQEALAEWGTPTSPSDISSLFTSYLNSRSPSIPWCPTPLDRESQAILPLLLRLNDPSQGWWTVGSQPAVDGAVSEHDVYGFGPRGGFVFQKAFVEFFVKKEVVDELEKRAESEGGLVTFYAANKKGDFRTNMEGSDVNAVTWAIFPGQEIVQSTIIEEVSFLSWKEEAFSIWQDWSYLYPPSSPSRKLLNEIADEYWLVSLVHHDFKDPHALEGFLLGPARLDGIDASPSA